MTLSVGDRSADVSRASASLIQSNSKAYQPTRKVIAPPGVLDSSHPEITLWHDYGSFALYRLTEAVWEQLPPEVKQKIHLADDMDRFLIDALGSNTKTTDWGKIQDLAVSNVSYPALQLIQFVGPIKDDWLHSVEKTGATLIQYIATNAYLVWADTDSRKQLDQLVIEGELLQFSAPFPPALKVGPNLAKRNDPNELVPVVIQMYRHGDNNRSETAIQNLEFTRSSAWATILKFQNTITSIRVGDIPKIANLPDVYWIEERMAREMTDEVQGQIMAGNLNLAQSGPSNPGYLTWLDSYGFSTNPNDYPIVDITDDGIGNGTVDSGDPTLHQLGDSANPSRLAYVANCTSAADGGGIGGHGHINVSIAGGYDARSGFPYQDSSTYLRGLGINPYGRFAGTRVFDPGFDLSNCEGDDQGLIKSIQDHGTFISSNSWSCQGCASTYDDSSQAFDAGTRDADPSESGNQEMTFIFAAGNSGPASSTIGTPGNGKNMITVGASENYRPSDEDGNWTDGCFIGTTGADDAMDVIFFSSRGPAPGGRVKPELIAPGTHIQGTASTNASYDGTTVCDQYRPSGQTIFAASSGTSHSTPALAGAASLVYWWLKNTYSISPSPALIKAYLIAHPTYLTGTGANDTLPSNNQGYGMPDLSAMFDDAHKVLVNQSVIFHNSGETWTWSGGVADPTKPVRLVLTYTDAPGAIGTSPQVNDLNLAADIGSSTYLGNIFSGQWSTTGGTSDSANNYEAIFLPVGTNGNIEITVTGFNIAGDGIPNYADGTDQDFALVCYNCTDQYGFTLNASPDTLAICSPEDALYNVEVGQIASFTDPVSLSASGNPAGSSVNFSVNPVIPPGNSTMTIGNTGEISSGSYDIEITGSSSTGSLNKIITLNSFDTPPNPVTLLSPTNDATGVGLYPSFEWSAVPLASSYFLEVALDAEFTNITYTATEFITSHVATLSFNSLTKYYWRVSAQNACGVTNSNVHNFTTMSSKLTCNGPAESFETGIPGDWQVIDNSGGTGILWTTTADTACASANHTNGSGEAACADSDAAGPDAPAYDTELILNPLNLTSYTSAAMDIKAYYVDSLTDTNDRFDIDVWDGSIWTNELRWDEDHISEDINLDLSSFAGLPTVQVRFHYSGDGSDGYAQLDDISLTCTAPVINIEPANLTSNQHPNMTTTLPITITNNGGSDLIWDILENDCGSPTDIPWLSVSPINGNTLPTGETRLDITFDSSGLVPGTYLASICVASNDPLKPNLSIPVEMVVELLNIDIAKNVQPATIFEPGEVVEYTIVATNTNSVDLEIESLVDSDLDSLIYCPDAVGKVLTAGGSYTCSFDAFLSSNVDEQYLSSITITANDIYQNSVRKSANTILSILDVDPIISITYEPDQSYVQTGDNIDFTITITNNSVTTDPLTIELLIDDIFGDVTHVQNDISATDCFITIAIQPGHSYSCSYTAVIPDLQVNNWLTTMTVTGSDDEGNQVLSTATTTLFHDHITMYLPLVAR